MNRSPAAVTGLVICALLGVPVFFADEAPYWARIATAIAIIATVIGIGLLAAARRQPA